ncbi:MAG: glycosyltransferase family 39 protein, partial [Pseudomonadota bacterium]
MNLTSGRGAMWLALALFGVTVLVLVLLRPLLPVDETRYLTVAWEMWQGGSKLVPHLNGDLYTQKPPLLFWLMNLVWSVTGVTEVGARLVAPAFGLASVGLTAVLARRLWPDSPDRA